MDARIARWLDREQTINERLASAGTEGVLQLNLRHDTLRPSLLPERRPRWHPEVVWLPRDQARTYGPVREALQQALGVAAPAGHVPLVLHPQSTAAHRRLRATFGAERLAHVWATPTASYRTVLAWRHERPPVMLKLSLGARLGRLRRTITEYYMVTGLMVSQLLETMSRARRRALALDWCAETGGVVDTQSGTGWLLREFPAMMRERGAGELVPAFSLIAPVGSAPPLLLTLIRTSGMRAETFVIERLLVPYVRVFAALLLEEGIQLQGHAQNVLVEVHPEHGLTGRFVLRDLMDSSVNVAMRIARGRPLPGMPRGFRSGAAPFPLVRSATDYMGASGRRFPVAGSDTVERYGLRAFVWSVNTSLARFVRRYDATRVEHAYLALWRDEVMRQLCVDPQITTRPPGLAIDEAIAYYLAHVDWRAMGARPGATLAANAEPLPHDGVLRRRSGAVYARVESAWGDLYIDRGRPAFLAPAF